MINNKINLNNEINQKLNISLILSLFFFLFLPITFLFLSELVGFANIGLIIIFIALDTTQYDYYIYVYLKDNYQVFIRIVVFIAFIILFIVSSEVIFILLSFSAFIDYIYKTVRFILIEIVEFIITNIVYLISNFFQVIKGIFRWIFEFLKRILLLIYLIIIHYLQYFLIIHVILKQLWENKLKTVKWIYFIVYLIGTAFLVFEGFHSLISMSIFIIMTILFIFIFNKEIIALIQYSIDLILNRKKEVFFALMWFLSLTSFGLCYLTLVLGFFRTAVPLFVMGIIFLHIAKIEVVFNLYKELIEGFVNSLGKIKQTFILILRKLYYFLLNEFLYRSLQVINVLLVVFGAYLLFSGIFDPTGSLTENLLGINIIALLPTLNVIFELLFGFSIITISIILYIITIQNKMKLVR